MTERILLLFLFFCLSCGAVIPQSKDFKLQTGFTAGYEFEEKKPVITINFGAEVIDGFRFGVKMGARIYEDDLNDMLFDKINEYYYKLSPGSYSVDAVLTKQTPTYITALYSTYSFFQNIEFNAAAGVKFYMDQTYSITDYYFQKPSMSAPPNLKKINFTQQPTMLKSKDIIKAFFSVGANYNYKSYLFGITADNMYSIGISIGKEF